MFSAFTVLINGAVALSPVEASASRRPMLPDYRNAGSFTNLCPAELLYHDVPRRGRLLGHHVTARDLTSARLLPLRLLPMSLLPQSHSYGTGKLENRTFSKVALKPAEMSLMAATAALSYAIVLFDAG